MRTVKSAILTAIEYWNIDMGHALNFSFHLQNVMSVAIEEVSISSLIHLFAGFFFFYLFKIVLFRFCLDQNETHHSLKIACAAHAEADMEPFFQSEIPHQESC